MMATWAEDEDIVCVHPGGTRMVGYDAVRAGWEQLFAGDTQLSFRLDQIVVIETVGLAMQSAIEHVTLGDDGSPRGAAIAHQRLPAHAVGLADGDASRVARAGGASTDRRAAALTGLPLQCAAQPLATPFRRPSSRRSQRRLTDADRHALPVLAAGADAGVEREVVADHRHAVSASGPLPISVAPFTG